MVRRNQFIFLLVLLILLSSCTNIQKHKYKYYNGEDENQIVTPLKQKVNNIINLMAVENWSEVYSHFAPLTKNELTEEDFSNQVDFLMNEFGVIKDVQILEFHFTYVSETDLKKRGNSYRMLSGKSEHLTNPVQLIYYTSGNNVIILGECDIKDSDLKCWLTLSFNHFESKWRLISFNLNTKIAKGHDGNWFLEKAIELENSNQNRSAYLYKLLGAKLSAPYYPVMVPIDANNIIVSFPKGAPDDFPTPNSLKKITWVINDNEYQISNITVISGPDLLTVDIIYFSDLIDLDNEEARIERSNIFDYVVKTYPEYKHNFDGVYISSYKSIGEGFRDYFEFKVD